jgi:hypothetical protein
MAFPPETEKRAFYEAVARAAVVELLREEHAAVWLEILSKLSERPRGSLKGVDPHHLITARRLLLKSREIEIVTEPTRGGGLIGVLALANRRLRQTAFAEVAARKRLLQARYLSWTRASGKRPNMIGDAGERAAREALMAAARAGVGYRTMRTPAAGVGQLFGKPVPVGPLDAAASLVALDADEEPIGVTVLVEAKNVRQWIYPGHAELFQLLDKAAQLQLANPRRRLVPVLVCRQAHYTTFRMAKDLGFRVLYTREHPSCRTARSSPRRSPRSTPSSATTWSAT